MLCETKNGGCYDHRMLKIVLALLYIAIHTFKIFGKPKRLKMILARTVKLTQSHRFVSWLNALPLKLKRRHFFIPFTSNVITVISVLLRIFGRAQPSCPALVVLKQENMKQKPQKN